MKKEPTTSLTNGGVKDGAWNKKEAEEGTKHLQYPWRKRCAQKCQRKKGWNVGTRVNSRKNEARFK